MSIKVIYHSADYDGIFSREACRIHFQDTTKKVEYIGWNWGDPTPEVDVDDELIMVDLAVEELMDHPNLIWIDHHASAIEKFSKDIPGLRIDGVAACRLAWQYYHGDRDASKKDYVDRKVEEPRALTLVGEFDIWDHSDDDTLLCQFGLDAMKFRTANEEAFDELLVEENDELLDNLLDKGEAAKAWAEAHYEQICSEISFDITWEGLTFLACNLSLGNSNSFTSHVKDHHDGLLSFKYDGEQTKVSLYQTPHRTDLDLSKISVKYGGGGHKGASGFRVSGFPKWLRKSEEGATLSEKIQKAL